MIRLRMKNYNMILIEKLQKYLPYHQPKLISNQKKIIEQTTFINSILDKAFEKQTKTIEDQGRKLIDAIKTLKPKELKAIEDKSDDNEKHLKYREVFNELSNERRGEIYNISKKIDFNSLTYPFKGPNLAPIIFIDFRGPIHVIMK